MGLEAESRSSESPYVDRVWRSHSDAAGMIMSVATAQVELVFWEHRGVLSAAVRGPESRATRAEFPEGTTSFGITFALGVTMPHLPARPLVDGAAVIPDVTRRSFWLGGSTWRRPGYDNAEAFVRRLVRDGILAEDPLVAAALRGARPEVSDRTLQRRFAAATGLTREAVRQIGRARDAAMLLRRGMPAVEVVHDLGYFDQPHLARSLTRYIGRSATRLSDPDLPDPLSLLYKT